MTRPHNRFSPTNWPVATIAASVALLVVVLALGLFVAHFYRAYFSSDDAVLSMLAQSMYDQGRLFPEGWITNNGDLMMPSGALLLAPLLAWFPNGFNLHAFVSLVTIALMLIPFACFLRAARVPLPVLLLATAIVASGFSWISAVLIYAQTTYMWWPAGFMVGATLIWKLRTQGDHYSGGRFDLLAIALFALIFVLCLANPGRVAVMMVLPLLAFDRAVALRLEGTAVSETGYRKWIRLLGLRDRLTLVCIGASFLLALIVYRLLLHFGITQTEHFASRLTLASWRSIADHLRIFGNGWFAYLGAIDERLLPKYPGAIVLRAFRLLFSVWLTWVAVAEVARIRRADDVLRRALAIAFVAAFVPIFVIYILFDPLAINYVTTRYFTVPMVILAALGAIRIGSISGTASKFLPVGIIVASIVLVGVAVQRFIPVASWSGGNFFAVGPFFNTNLANVLRREGLKWGYATWWNAEGATVMGDSQASIHPITLDEGLLAPYPVMVQSHWYDSAAWKGDSFLALDRREASAQQIADVIERIGPPVRTIDSPEHLILVYDHNISVDFTCAARTPMSERLDGTRPTGQIVSAAQVFTADGAPRNAATIVVQNSSDRSFDGAGAFPISIGIHLLDESGTIVSNDWLHSPLPCSIAPGEQRSVKIILPPTPPGNLHAKVDLVQEGVAWFEQWGAPTATMPLRPAKTP